MFETANPIAGKWLGLSICLLTWGKYIFVAQI
jgi:hypothetical protein